MVRRSLRHLGTALTLLALFAGQETWALASVTGGLTGSVLDAETLAPIAGVQVTATSPSQTATVTTDAAGHFGFLTLSPDTYTVTASKDGYQSTSVPGQTVFADTVQIVSVRMPKALRTIAHVAAAAGGALVKSGTTADLYSVNATTQKAAAALGGGASLNQAYSAIATIPGAYVVPNQAGYFETINIRGGDYDQVGYEFDGVPVVRSFDNYGSSSASSIGNAEVQVYNGATPASSEGQGLSGYLNQVIKTGTFPGYATGSLGIGTPAFYHQASLEVGGATPDRLFSYYFGIQGVNQALNYINNQNGAQYIGWFGPPMGFIPNGSYALQCILGSVACLGAGEIAQGPIQYSNFSTIYDRNAVINLHFAIPHHNDAGRDDVQFLYDDESLVNQLYESAADFASPECTGANGTSGVACATYLYGPQVYPNVPSWGCPSNIGKTFSGSGINGLHDCVVSYGYPNVPNPGSFTDPNTISPSNTRDNTYNQTAITKLQYTKNFGSTAFLRLYGYTFYSTWDLAGVYGGVDCDFFCTVAPDYELNTHTRGISGVFEDQINEQNLVSLQGNYTTATITRMNNHFLNVPGEPAAVIVNPNDPYSGYCYGGVPSKTGSLPVVDCYNTAASSTSYGYQTFGQIYAGTVPSVSGLSCAVPGQPQYGTSCQYMVAENGLNAEITPGLVPNFYGWSLTDQYRPSDKWLFNLGLRLDTFNFAGGNEAVPPVGGGGPEVRQFWWNAFNLDNCQNTTTGFVFPNPSPGKLCPAGSIQTYMQNLSYQNFTFNVLQPRLAGTYTVNPNNVIRFSAGRYTESGNTAFMQYGTWQEDSADFIGPTFLQYGRNTPGYPIQPQTSLNYDLSWESHLKGTDWSFKVTPFLRQTQEQIQEFFLNVKEGFVSGLNAGDQRSQGLEFQLQKGDFTRNGFSGLLSFAYTNSYITYGPVNPYGATVLAGVNNAIAEYNAYTAACVHNPTNPNCGTTSANGPANACYTTGGIPVAPVSIHGTTITCPKNDFINPYWFAPIQSIINTHSQFATYDLFPGSTAFPGAYGAYNAPYVASMVINYKHNKYAITPSLQFEGGERYGYPLSSVGIDPAAGCGLLTGVPGRYNATTCASVVNIPDPYTNGFDTLGAFVQPSEFMLNLQASYDMSPQIQLVGTLANIVNYCWGGSHEAWTASDGNICQYATPIIGGIIDPVAPYTTPGSTANPPGHSGSIIQSGLKYPYGPNPGPFLAAAQNSSFKLPFEFYFTANIKI